MNDKKQYSLNALLRSYLRTALIPMLVIEVVLLLLYFGINYHISQKYRETLMQGVRQNAQEILSRESRNISHQLEEVSRLATLLQLEQQRFFQNPDLFGLPNGEPIFERAGNGVFYKSNHAGASLYYSSRTKIGEKEYQKARHSEALDVSFKNIVDTNPNIVAAYLNTWDDMNRLYPFIDKVYNVYGAYLKMEDYNFYYLANERHNPDRKPVWTGAYLDPAGQGWMLSCIVPIYNKAFLEGVTGLDVTIEKFIANILDLDLPWQASVFMADAEGMILAMPGKIEAILGIKELKEHRYTGNIRTTVEKPRTHNLLNHKDPKMAGTFAEILKNGSKTAELHSDGKMYILVSEEVPLTGWKLMMLVDKEVIFQPVFELKRFSDLLGYGAIGLMLFFYLLFFLYLLRRSEEIAREIYLPIKKLSAHTKNVGKGFWSNGIEATEIEEIEQLNRNFSDMVHKLDARTEALIGAELEKREKEREAKAYFEKSITDPLTKLYNRAKVDMAIDDEMEKSRRYHLPFSLIMLDIDHFKKVNDTFGHQAGDEVLTEIANILKQYSRQTDIVARWGGEEFLLICFNSGGSDALMHANGLRQRIEHHRFAGIGRLTASFGIAEYTEGDSKQALLKKADDALYRAKVAGRNRAVFYAKMHDR